MQEEPGQDDDGRGNR
jgi:uncharacterized membrane protein YgcG